MEIKNKKNCYASKREYNNAMEEILRLMNKGEANLTAAEKKQLRTMAEAAESYEEIHYPFPMPETLEEMVEIKLLEKKLTRARLAEMIGISAPKVSQILNKKRKADVDFMKALHTTLEIDGNFILEHA